MSLAQWGALAVPAALYAGVLALHIVLPARLVEGYVDDPATGRPYRYRLNGILVLGVVVAVWLAAGGAGLLHWDALYTYRWSMAAGACLLGAGYTLFAVLGEPSTGRGLAADLFYGRRENVQYFGGRVDAKMFLYLAGATVLMLNVLAFAAHHHAQFGANANPGVTLHAALLAFFVLDYLIFERVHLYTWDLFAERVGFKLGWGCLAFYPFFYTIGLWSTVELPAPALTRSLGWTWLVFSGAVFFGGWVLARGANLQKYAFKRFPERRFLGQPQVAIEAGNQRLLCGGFWRVARHVNYLGEILMALGLVLSLGHLGNPWPWLYPLYYVLLLVPRERADNRRCAEKYGPLWDVYQARVRYRIVPGVY